MRQVPQKSYLLIGDGKLATHLSYYLNTQGIKHQTWNRKSSNELLTEKLSSTDIALLAISDDSIEEFVNSHQDYSGTWVHFSGSFYSKRALGLHPLMTFSNDLYEVDTYKQIPFIVDKGVVLGDIFPQLENPHFELDPQLKSFYHSLLVIGGNFTAILWKEVSKRFETQLKLPAAILKLYIFQTFMNIIRNPDTAVTGPLVRGDRSTIIAHLNALSGTQLQSLYYSFLNFVNHKKDSTSSKSIFETTKF